MPDRENILRRIYTVVVGDTASARPFSSSKSCDTFRLWFGQAVTTRTGLAGVCLVNFLKKMSAWAHL